MANHLVIVESPAKAKTIEKYLGKDFKVMSSVGHIIDLPTNKLGVDIENNFEPEYEIIKGKKKVIDALKKAAAESDIVYLATDPDREGEAIGWHISESIKKKAPVIKRVQFNEITKNGILKGIKNPSELNMNMVNAQQARRVLDRLVGYLVSPLLWKPLRYGLSAGRVQSVALKLICEREEEIEKFKPEEYWTFTGFFKSDTSEIKARLEKISNKKVNINNKTDAEEIYNKLLDSEYKISGVEKKEVKQSPPPPFITSGLQQEAIRRFGFSGKKTMMIAQRLYEGIELGNEGPVGLITYMRTDSTRISNDAMEQAEKFIIQKYGKEYLPAKKRIFKQKSENVQDAHEAIRPTSINYPPEKVKNFLNNEQYKIYKLIWDRFIASQMAEAIFYQSVISIIGNDTYLFKAKGKILKFPGFMKLYIESKEDDVKEEDAVIYDVKESEVVLLEKLEKKQNFTQPPPRYTESSLIRLLEQKGIGRPSTYVSIISTINDRGYVKQEKKKLYPTELGRIVNSLLNSNFPRVFDVPFTAEMEKDLDEIAEGKVDWKEIIKEFYEDFDKELSLAQKQFVSDLTVDMDCPECGAKLKIKYGKNGAFLACSNYPDCKFTSDYTRDEEGRIILVERKNNELAGIKCENCGSEMVFKRSKYGDIIACPEYPKCKNIKNFMRTEDGKIKIINSGEKVKEKCPECKGDLVVKVGKNGVFIACNNYPDCKFTANAILNKNGDFEPKIIKIAEVKCEKCGSPMKLKSGRKGKFFACTGFPKCRNTKAAVERDGIIQPK
jgi:DNA topoisomerase-1